MYGNYPYSGAPYSATEGGVAPVVTVALTGVSATGAVGSVVGVPGVIVALTGVTASGAVGTVGTQSTSTRMSFRAW